MEKVDLNELVRRYCETQDCEPPQVLERLKEIRRLFEPDGFFLAQAQDMSSSFFGTHVIIPYGGKSTFAAPPTGVFTPRGLASDSSVVTAVYEIQGDIKELV